LSCLFDSAILALDIRCSSDSVQDVVQIILQSFRVFCNLSLVGSALAFSVSCWNANEHEEIEPLLSPNTHGTAKVYSSISSPDNDDSDAEDEPESIKKARIKREQHLAERGNWLAYLKDFRMVFALLWPSDNPYVLSCSWLLLALLLADRALNVLIPR